MKIFSHHIYEFKKGLRNLVLCTMKLEQKETVEARLKREGIHFLIWPLKHDKINVFFGAENCIKTLESFNKNSLNAFTPEEDFILGIMLGYDRLKQCERYLNIQNNVIRNFCKVSANLEQIPIH